MTAIYVVPRTVSIDRIKKLFPHLPITCVFDDEPTPSEAKSKIIFERHRKTAAGVVRRDRPFDVFYRASIGTELATGVVWVWVTACETLMDAADTAARLDGQVLPRHRAISFERACEKYQQRFTMEHVPEFTATRYSKNGKQLYHGPSFETDREWYDHTVFPGDDNGTEKAFDHPVTTNQAWPLGQYLEEPYKKP